MHHDLVPNRKPFLEMALGALHVLRSRSGNSNFNLLHTESRMFRTEHDRSGLFGRSNPDRSRSSGEREGVVADDLAWAAQFEDNRIIRDGPDAIELVCYAKDDARCVRTIPTKFVVVRECDELTVHPAAGVALRNNLLILDIAVDAQIAPVPDGCLFERNGEGRIAQMRELVSVGGRLCDHPETITAFEIEL